MTESSVVMRAIPFPTRLYPEKSGLPVKSQCDLVLLAICIWGEARGESEDGKAAVAHVVLNRWKKQSWYGETINDVILKPYQFSFFNKPVDLSVIKNDLTWESCVFAAWEAILGISTDPTHGATHYCRWDCWPAWRKNLKFTCQIGQHVFYRYP